MTLKHPIYHPLSFKGEKSKTKNPKKKMPPKVTLPPKRKALVLPLFIKGDILKVKWAWPAHPKAILTWNATVVDPTVGHTTVSYRENIGKQEEDILPNPELITISVTVVRSKKTGSIAPLPPPPPPPTNPRVLILLEDGVTYKRLPTAMADAVISAYMALIEKSAKEAPSVVRITDPNTGVITVADFVKMMYGLQTMKVILN